MPAIYINDMGRIIEVVSRNYMIVCLLTINKSINKMKKYLFLLSALLVYDYTFAQNQDTIKFENLVGLIKIPIQINGKEKYFMFDTGAEITAIREDNTSTLDITHCSRKKIKDANNHVTTQSTYVVQSLKFGNSDISNLSVVTFPNSPLFNCLGIEGIIGIDIIKRFDWLVDFDKKQIVKIDPSDTIKGFSDFVAMDFHKNKLRPGIKLKIGNKVVDFLFDSGSNTNTIDKKCYGKIKDEIVQSYEAITTMSGASSMGKQSKESLIIVNTQPENLDLRKHRTLFNTISVGENKIGNEFWGHNQIFLSWTKNKLLFRVVNTEKEKTFSVFFKILNDSIIVNSLTFTEQIIKSGVKVNEKVKSINGKSFTDYCELLRYQLLTKENTLTVELQDGKQFTFKKENIY